MFHYRFPPIPAPLLPAWDERDATPPDRRIAIRASIRSLVGKVHDDHGESACMVLDLSERGVLARLSFRPSIGQALELELHGLPRCVAHVRYVDGTKVGMEFVRRQNLDLIVSLVSEDDWAARAPRFKVAMRAVVRLGSRKFPARVVNISTDGVRLQADTPVELGEAGHVILSGHPGGLPGTIRWVEGNTFGLQFSTPLAPGNLDEYLKD